MKIGIIGAGRWACTLANILCQNGNEVALFCIEEDFERITANRQIPHTDFFLNDKVGFTTSGKLLTDCEIVIIAVDGFSLYRAWKQWGSYVSGIVVIAVKTMSISKEKPLLPTDEIKYPDLTYFASGAFPEGLLKGSPAIGTVYGPQELTNVVRAVFPKYPLRIYTSTDIIGGQIVSALKNVLAIACGVASGMGLDEMTMAAIMSRGLFEIRRFGVANGAKAETFGDGSSGLADTIGTCISRNSHNFQAGLRLASGDFDIKSIENEIGTAEGIWTAQAFIKPNTYFLMPIAYVVANVIFNGLELKKAMEVLMERPIH